MSAPDDKPGDKPDDKPGDVPPARPTYGTVPQDAPVTRADFERALRYLNLANHEVRDSVLRLAAQVVALTDELVRRVDHLEPEPAPPDTAAAPPTNTIEQAVVEAMPHGTMMMRVSDERVPGRVALDIVSDKYTETPADVPCAELVHLCQARCCSFTFSLSTQDLDEGVIRWDHGQPYLIRQRASDGYCVHNDPGSHGCTVHQYRPRICRLYDCREDERVWIDYEKRIPAPPLEGGVREVKIDLVARAKARYEAIAKEIASTRKSVAEEAPAIGPPAETTLRPKH